MAKQPKIGAKIVLDGEREYKQAIKNINTDQKVLTSELEKTTAQYAGNAKSVEALTAKSGIYNKQIEKVKSKIDVYRKALEESTKKHGEADDRTKAWQVSLNKAESELHKLNGKLETNNKDLGEADKKVEGLGISLKKNLTNAAVVAGIVLVADKLKDAAKAVVKLSTDAAAYADTMLTLSTQTGISTDKLQAYNYAAELMDVDLNTLTGSMQKHIRAMFNAEKGTKDYTDAYAKLKVNAVDPATGALRDSETVYWEVIEALGRMTNETERDATAMLLFGRSAQDLNPLIAQGSKGIAELTAEAEKMGAILSTDTLNSLGKTDDAFQRMQQSVDIAKRKIGAEMAPEVEKAMSKITNKISGSSDEIADFAGGALDVLAEGFIFVVENGEKIIPVLAGIGTGMVAFKAASAGIAVATSAVELYSKVTKTAAAAQTTLNVAQSASPMGAIAAVIGLAAGAITAYAVSAKMAGNETDELSENIEEANRNIDNFINNIKKEREIIEASAGAAQMLAEEIYTLAEKENISNSEKAQMVTLVDQLNKAMPNLNLAINNETGALSKQRGEVNQLIEANLKLYKVKAAQDSLSDTARQMFEQDRKKKELEQVISEIELIYDKEAEIAGRMSNRPKGKEKEAIEIGKELRKRQKELKDVEKNVAALQGEWKYASDYIKDNSDIVNSMKENADGIKEMGDAAEETGAKVVASTDSILQQMSNLKQKYTDTLASRTNDIRKSLGLFQDVDFYPESKPFKYTDYVFGNIDSSIPAPTYKNGVIVDTEIKANGTSLTDYLREQVDYMAQYSGDIKALGERDISTGLLEELRSMGIGASKEIKKLNEMTDEELTEYSKLWETKSKLAGELATAELAGLKTEIDAELAGLEAVYYNSGVKAVNDYTSGLIAGVAKNSPALAKAISGLASVALASGGVRMGGNLMAPPPTLETIERIVKRTIEAYKPDIYLDDDKVGYYVSNKVAREMYTK